MTRRDAAFKAALAGHASVVSVASAGAVPGRIGWRGQISFPEGCDRPTGSLRSASDRGASVTTQTRPFPSTAMPAAQRFSPDTAAVLAHARRTWDEFFPGYPSELFFLDDEFARQYEGDRRLMRIFGTFSALAVAVAGMGLFGLAAFSASRRTREIGVRKTLGATTGSVVALLGRDFLKPVAAGILVAAPVAYYLMTRWLQGFAYRTPITAGVFIAGAVLLLAAASAAVASQALRAARVDPAESLRYE